MVDVAPRRSREFTRTRTREFKVGLAAIPSLSRFGPNALLDLGYLTAAANGADSFWVPDHLNSLFPRSLMTPTYVGAARLVPKTDAMLEPWTMLGHLASRHRLRRLRLGTAVTDVGRRNPAVTAQAAATLHLMTKGRAILGIGTGEREGNEPYGVDWSRPVARFEEALATIRALWNSNGELVNRDSEFFPLHDAVFDLPPYKGRWPEIWIAAHGPRMLRAAGRYADAWFPAVVTRPDHYVKSLAAVRTAASDAGRDPMAMTASGWLNVVTGRSRDEVDEALASPIAKATALLIPAEAWARHGVIHPMGDDFSGLQDIIPQVLDADTVLKWTADVPKSLLDEFLLTGTPDEVLERAAQWRDSGMDYGVMCDVSTMQPSLFRGLAASIPFMKILRGLRRL